VLTGGRDLLIAEPPPTAYDLRFRVAGIPVRVHPLFWLAALFLGGFQLHPREMLIWIAVCFGSILLHEMGHALFMRRFAQVPRVVLYVLGGLAISGHDPYSYSSSYSRPMSTRENLLVLLAGPGAQLLLAGLLLAGIKLSGGEVEFVRDAPVFWRFNLGKLSFAEYPNLYILVHQLLVVNILWALINLLPVYPLDGGQIAREILVHRDHHRGVPQSLMVSMAAGIVMVLVALLYGSLFMAIMFGLLAAQSYMTLQQLRSGGGGWGEGRGW
jgi:stage IV sporulation protein FB